MSSGNWEGGREREPFTEFDLNEQGVGQVALVETCIAAVLQWYPDTTRPLQPVTHETVRKLVFGDEPMIERVGGVRLGINLPELQAGRWNSYIFDAYHFPGAGDAVVSWLMQQAELKRGFRNRMKLENLELLGHHTDAGLRAIIRNSISYLQTEQLPELDISTLVTRHLGPLPRGQRSIDEE